MSGEIHALSGAYAINAVNDIERAEFERHLTECAACRAEVASLQEAAGALGQQASAPAPASLRSAVLDEITRVRPLPPVSDPPPPQEELASVTPLTRRWAPALVAAAVVATLGIGGAVWQPWNQEETSQVQLTASERVLAASDAEEVTLAFPDGARATVTRSKSQGRAVITTRGMPQAPEGRVYELWLKHEDGSLAPAGLMPRAEDQTFLLEGDATEALGAGITVEPEGGSEQPTTDAIAFFEFPEST